MYSTLRWNCSSVRTDLFSNRFRPVCTEYAILRFFLYCQHRARLLQKYKPSSVENLLLVETNVCRIIICQILVALADMQFRLSNSQR